MCADVGCNLPAIELVCLLIWMGIGYERVSGHGFSSRFWVEGVASKAILADVPSLFKRNFLAMVEDY